MGYINMVDMRKDMECILFSEEDIQNIVNRVAAEIDRDYEGKKLLVVGVLKGSFIFMADLVRQMKNKCELEFMAVSSYGAGTTSSGQLAVKKDISTDLTGYDVLLIEDILDSGFTVSKVKEMLQQRNANSVKVCVFLDKKERRTVDIEGDYVGAVVPDAFVVGYGLDYAQLYRNLPYVGVLKKEIYEGK